MTTREMFRKAYSAARTAQRDMDTLGLYQSPLVAALDATRDHHTFERYRLCAAAEWCAGMHRSYRVRRAMRVVVRPTVGFKLAQLAR